MAEFGLALVQMKVGREKEDNLRRAEEAISRAAGEGADIVVLPEMFICPYDSSGFPQYAEPAAGPSVARLSAAAADNGIVLIGGSIPEVDDAGRIYNSCFCFSGHGEIIGCHRKIHLFDINIKNGVSFRESETLSPGRFPTIIDTGFGRIGVAICFDIRFAELFRFMVQNGAEMVIVPAAFNMTTGPAHWELSFRMRAVDNQIFTAGAAPARDPSAGYVSYANSLVCDPWGRVLASAGEDECILHQRIDLSAVHQIREQLPILSNVRASY